MFFSPIMLCVAAAWLCSCVLCPDDNVFWLLSSPLHPPPLRRCYALLLLFLPPPFSFSTCSFSSSLNFCSFLHLLPLNSFVLLPPFVPGSFFLSSFTHLFLDILFPLSLLSLCSCSSPLFSLAGRPWAEEAEGKSVTCVTIVVHYYFFIYIKHEYNASLFSQPLSVQHRPCGPGWGSLWIQKAAKPLEVTNGLNISVNFTHQWNKMSRKVKVRKL